ncbi:hypothetical protein NIASO_20525 [Niabella soli DSM 19437]|uniref:Peptidase M56 domain-containing protein n=2 Tax=Niabella TaxID=379899 RepID=W0F515_9BACT|nr:hypothetical protein NIASO_20525 [Niabella soli DSM 19437]
MIACSGLLYAFYFFFLRKEKMLVFNRFYLLGSIILSFLIPLCRFETKMSDKIGLPDKPFIEMYSVTKEPLFSEKAVINLLPKKTTVAAGTIVYIVFISVSLLLFFRFVINLFHYRRLIKNNPKIKKGRFSIILLEQDILPHSFINSIFLSRSTYEGGLIDQEILLHEEAHITQRHSFDILFVEAVMIVFWFNPFLLLFRKYIRINHEFLADTCVVQNTGDRSRYAEAMLKMACPVCKNSLASNFYFITKKRLMMLYKETSVKVKLTRGLITLFVFVSLILIFSDRLNGTGQKMNLPGDAGKDASGLINPGNRHVGYTAIQKDVPEEGNREKAGIEQGAAILKADGIKDLPVNNEGAPVAKPEGTTIPGAALSIEKDSLDIPYKSYPVNKGLSEEKMTEFNKFIEKYVMEVNGEKVFWYKQMLRPALDLYFGMTDQQRSGVNKNLPQLFLAAGNNELVRLNGAYRNNRGKLFAVYPDGKTVSATITNSEEKKHFIENFTLDINRYPNQDCAFRTYLYKGKSVAMFVMFYSVKKEG